MMMSKIEPKESPIEFTEILENNPTIASVILLDPVAGLEHFGIGIPESDTVKLGAAPADSARAETITANGFKLPEPQAIQFAARIETLAAPTLAGSSFDREPDFSINTSAGILEYAIKRFAMANFSGRRFEGMLRTDWWRLDGSGRSVSFALTENGPQLFVEFECELFLDLKYFAPDRIRFPLKIEILPAFAVSGDRLYLSISKGQISLINFAFPYRCSEDLAGAFARIIPPITVCNVPVAADLPDNEFAPPVFLTGANVDGNGIALTFHIDAEFEANTFRAEPVQRGAADGALKFLSEDWAGQPSLWNYPHYSVSDETHAKSCGHAALATFSDFFERNPFSLDPIEETGPDGKQHFRSEELVGSFYNWYFPRIDTIGESGISGSDDLLRALNNLKLTPREQVHEDFGDPRKAQKTLTDWITKTKLPALVLLDTRKLPALENLATGENDPVQLPGAHWAIIFAVNRSGVRVASWGSEYFVPWAVFMRAWNCESLANPYNYYHIQISGDR